MKKAVEFVKDKANVEVIVVENASEDGTPEMIAKKHPWVKLMPSGADLGYGKGNNFGFKKSDPKNKYILLLNNDAYVERETLANSLEYLEQNDGCDVMGCRLHFEDGRFQPSAGYLPTPMTVWSWIWGLEGIPLIGKLFSPFHPKDPEFFEKDRKVGWVMGAFLFMKREVYAKTKGFDENFFLYGEEVEWCRRAKEAGYNICYTPNFSVTHLDKSSAKGDPKELAKIFRREILGIIYYMKINYKSQMWWILPMTKLGVTLRLMIFSLLGNTMRQDAYKQTLEGL